MLAAADHKKFPAPPHAKVFIDSEKKKKEETDAQRGQAATATRKANKKDKAHNGKGKDKAKGAAAVDSLPLEELSCALAPTETFGPLNHGVAHRNMLHGIDSVIKIVDADKDVDGTEALEHEASLYMELGDIWGTAIPSMVYAGRLSMGRASLALTYEGKSLEQAAPTELGMEPEELKRKSLSALEALHQHGVLHGDLAPRNIVVNPATKAVKLIDLGSARRSNDKALMAGEVQALSALFDNCDE